MKRILALTLALAVVLMLMTSCSVLEEFIDLDNIPGYSTLFPDANGTGDGDENDSTAGGDNAGGDNTQGGNNDAGGEGGNNTEGDGTGEGDGTDGDNTTGDGNSGTGDSTDGTTAHRYTEFSASDIQLFNTYIGAVIPFVPNDEYYIEGYYDETDYENGLNFYTLGNTREEFDAYILLFSDYKLTDTYYDDYGDEWNTYEKGTIVVDIAYYNYDGEDWIDVFIYSDLSSDGEGGDSGNTGGSDGNDNNPGGDSGNTGDGSDDDSTGGNSGNTGSGSDDDSTGGNSGNTGSGSEDDGDTTVITNNGKGLPEDNGSGVHNLDFTNATNVKDVTDQGYYLDGCPTTGSPAVLVIPVEFSDVTAANKGYSIDAIKAAFEKGGKTDYYSVYDYYYISSYGALTLDVTVLDFWFRPAYNSSYYENETIDYYGEDMTIGDQIIINEALAYLSEEKGMDLSKYDSDCNGTIDSIVLINTLDINQEKTFYWAYRYWNIYTDDEDYYYEYDGVYANDYLWAPYQFLHEGTDYYGNVTYDDVDAMNTYTFIHEFGHVLGADDYYDTAYIGSPMDGRDIMDGMTGDHNAFTKFNYGWLTTSRLVVASSSVTLKLGEFADAGDTIIIANNWDDTLGAYQEYYVITYYTSNGLNGGDNGYFESEGIVVYHVNASLYKEVQGDYTYYDVYNNNTDESEGGSANNLIELVESPDGDYIFEAGESLGMVYDDSNALLSYTFTVSALGSDEATIVFTKR